MKLQQKLTVWSDNRCQDYTTKKYYSIYQYFVLVNTHAHARTYTHTNIQKHTLPFSPTHTHTQIQHTSSNTLFLFLSHIQTYIKYSIYFYSYLILHISTTQHTHMKPIYIHYTYTENTISSFFLFLSYTPCLANTKHTLSFLSRCLSLSLSHTHTHTTHIRNTISSFLSHNQCLKLSCDERFTHAFTACSWVLFSK